MDYLNSRIYGPYNHRPNYNLYGDDFGSGTRATLSNLIRHSLDPKDRLTVPHDRIDPEGYNKRFLGDYYIPGIGSVKNIEDRFIEITKRRLTPEHIPGIKTLIASLRKSGTEENLRHASLLEKCLPDEQANTSVPPAEVVVETGAPKEKGEETEIPMPPEEDIRNLYDDDFAPRDIIAENFSKMLKFKVAEKNAPALRRVIDHFKSLNYNPEFISRLESCLPDAKSDMGPSGPNGSTEGTLGVEENIAIPPKEKEEEIDRPDFCDGGQSPSPCAPLGHRFARAASGRDLINIETISSEEFWDKFDEYMRVEYPIVKEKIEKMNDIRSPVPFAGPSVPVRFYHVHLPGEVTKDFSTAEEAEKCIRDYYLSQKGKECCLNADIGNDIKWIVATSPFSKSLVFNGVFSAPSVPSEAHTSHSSETPLPPKEAASPSTKELCRNPRCDKCVTQRFKDGEIARLEKTSSKWEKKQKAKMEKWERKQNTKTLKRIEAFKARKLKHGITESCV